MDLLVESGQGGSAFCGVFDIALTQSNNDHQKTEEGGGQRTITGGKEGLTSRAKFCVSGRLLGWSVRVNWSGVLCEGTEMGEYRLPLAGEERRNQARKTQTCLNTGGVPCIQSDINRDGATRGPPLESE